MCCSKVQNCFEIGGNTEKGDCKKAPSPHHALCAFFLLNQNIIAFFLVPRIRSPGLFIDQIRPTMEIQISVCLLGPTWPVTKPNHHLPVNASVRVNVCDKQVVKQCPESFLTMLVWD